MIDVPDVVANKARSLGADAWVADAVDGHGRPAVLKLCVPRAGDDPLAEARREITVLDRADGRGCVTLRRSDVDRGALLLERLGPSLADLGVAFPARLEILCRLVSQLWTSPSGLDLITGAEKAAWLVDFVESGWEELDRPCSPAAVDLALQAALRRGAAHDDERAVLAHGDVHQWNTLQAEPGGGPSGWKLIDPDGLIVEPEYDLGVLLREDPEELMADVEAGDRRRRARWLAHRTGTDAEAIWEWGLVERVSTGLLATSIDLQPVGSQMLTVADRLAAPA